MTVQQAYAVEHAATTVLALLLLVLLVQSTWRFGLRQFEHPSGRRLLWLTSLVAAGLLLGL